MGKGEIVEELLDEDPEGAPGDEAALQYVSFLLALSKWKHAKNWWTIYLDRMTANTDVAKKPGNIGQFNTKYRLYLYFFSALPPILKILVFFHYSIVFELIFFLVCTYNLYILVIWFCPSVLSLEFRYLSD